jgi:peptide/nickel transport system permease protein
MDTLTRILNEAGRTLRLIARNPIGLIGLIMLIFFVTVSFLGPLVVPPEDEAHLEEINLGPSLTHPLGTDFQGKDNVRLLVYGGKEIMIIAFVAGLLTMVIAVAVGSFSAYVGGRIDTLLMEVTNIWLTVPRFIVLIVIAASLKLTNAWTLAVLLAFLAWPGFARQVRAQILSLRNREYVEAARLLDMGTVHIIFNEMVPNMMPFITTGLILAMTSAIYQQTGLVFLGLVPFSGSNWGVLLSLAFAKGAIYDPEAMWSVLAPMFAIILFQLSLIWFSRSTEEVFNPRLRTGV